ncbi:septation protein A [Orbus wheelerorum]|uniref:septation protein A n=1 Tax=Orbus wheelerorum TaxID=3074111 RepID=UPI00370D26D4
MKQLLNFIPLIFFFVFLTMYDIFAGVKALMISATLVFLVIWLINKKIEKMELFSYLMIMVFGGLTLYLHNEDFIKWKVTLINFLFAVVLLVSQIIFKKNLIQKLLGKELQLSANVWNKLNFLWAFFFIFCGLISLYVTYNMSTEFFGIFKAFILPGASLLLTLISGIYIYKQMDKTANKQSKE